MRNKRLVFAGIVILLAVVGVILYRRGRAVSVLKQQAQYQSIVRSYAAVLKTGATRAEVEGYIHSRNQKFTQQSLALPMQRDALTDLIKIGEGTLPSFRWPCNMANVYVVFEFEANEPRSTPSAADSDRLLDILWFIRPQPCLQLANVKSPSSR